jgi:mannitol/fructose-specific phosphotransferase system IIA component (Ntr-type)
LKLSSLITPDRIIDLKATSKNDALKELFRVIERAPEITDNRKFEDSIIERENILTTGIGLEIAVPHVKIPSVRNFVMALGRNPAGIDFDSLDGKPVKIVIMIGSSDRQRDEFLKVLARVVLLFKQEAFRRKILRAEAPEEVHNLIKGAPYSRS